MVDLASTDAVVQSRTVLYLGVKRTNTMTRMMVVVSHCNSKFPVFGRHNLWSQHRLQQTMRLEKEDKPGTLFGGWSRGVMWVREGQWQGYQ